MSFLLLLTLICVLATIPFIIWGVVSQWDSLCAISFCVIFSFAGIILLVFAIIQPFQIKSEMLRQNKERQQIVYQIENMTENSDKVKLNEWILTYNDWVNDVNTSKELYGWASWYYSADMSNHTIIELV